LLETLERKVEQHDNLLIDLKNEQHQLKAESSYPILRTCSHIRATLPSQTSGMYWIDPDGQGIGDEPIYVYCNMSTGKSFSILYFYKNYILNGCHVIRFDGDIARQ
jgi:hypothetical protein